MLQFDIYFQIVVDTMIVFRKELHFKHRMNELDVTKYFVFVSEFPNDWHSMTREFSDCFSRNVWHCLRIFFMLSLCGF